MYPGMDRDKIRQLRSHLKDNMIIMNFLFQVVAREANGGAASAPYSLGVQLLDQNDNAPVIPKTQPIIVPASLEPTAVHKVRVILMFI